jgi:hypothetical protein
MKTNIIKSIFFMVVLFLSSCESDLRMPEVSLATLPKITFDASSEKLIQAGVPYSGKFVVDTYYKDPLSDANIIIAMNGNYTSLKTFKTGVTTFPSTYTITDAELKTLFGVTTIVAGDYFQFGLDVLMPDGKWYPAFNPNGVAYGSGPSNLPGSSPILKLPAVCALNLDTFVGTVSVTDPDWYGGTYTTTIEKVDATHLKLKNYAELEGDIVLTIDPSTRLIDVPKQVYTTNLALWGMPQYTNPAAAGKGEIDACKNTISMTLTNTVDQGSFGNTAITIEYE